MRLYLLLPVYTRITGAARSFTTGLHQDCWCDSIFHYRSTRGLLVRLDISLLVTPGLLVRLELSRRVYTRTAGAAPLFTTGLHQDCWCGWTFHYWFTLGLDLSLRVYTRIAGADRLFSTDLNREYFEI
jgi:hypothetical protein